jgi:uncharacterized protein (DUF983 family)
MNEPDKALYPPQDPVSTGVKGRCPRCGEGRLFEGYLGLRKNCSVCGLDYSFADSGDGPAVFVILIIGFIVVGLALWMEVSYEPPIWLQLLLWVPLTIVLSLWLLRVLKGILVNLQYRNDASEGKIDDG